MDRQSDADHTIGFLYRVMYNSLPLQESSSARAPASLGAQFYALRFCLDPISGWLTRVTTRHHKPLRFLTRFEV